MNPNPPLLDKASFGFSQEGNTLGTTSEYEYLKIRLETQLPGERPFIVIETEGWSIDEPKELTTLIEKCLKAFENKNAHYQ